MNLDDHITGNYDKDAPFNHEYEYLCDQCGHEFDIPAERPVSDEEIEIGYEANDVVAICPCCLADM